MNGREEGETELNKKAAREGRMKVRGREGVRREGERRREGKVEGRKKPLSEGRRTMGSYEGKKVRRGQFVEEKRGGGDMKEST